jgi:hypothetical protein
MGGVSGRRPAGTPAPERIVRIAPQRMPAIAFHAFSMVRIDIMTIDLAMFSAFVCKPLRKNSNSSSSSANDPSIRNLAMFSACFASSRPWLSTKLLTLP